MMSERLPVARVAWRVVPLFHELSADDVARVMQLGVKREWQEGEDLIRQGDVATSLFVIEQGEVELSVERRTDIAPPSKRSLQMLPLRAMSTDLLPDGVGESVSHGAEPEDDNTQAKRESRYALQPSPATASACLAAAQK